MADFDLDLRSPPSKPSVSRRNLFYRPLVLDFLPSHTEEHLSKFYFLLTLEKQFCSQEMCFLYVRFTVTTTCYVAPFFCAAIRERDCAERLTLKGGRNNQSNNCARLENSIVTLSARLKSSFVQRLFLRADAFSSAARETLEKDAFPHHDHLQNNTMLYTRVLLSNSLSGDLLCCNNAVISGKR